VAPATDCNRAGARRLLGVDLPKRTNPRAYERAAELIASGTWIVDPVAGVIISKVYRQPLRPGITGTGYRQVHLWIPELKKATGIALHRVIWEHVHGTIPPGMEVNHQDGDKGNIQSPTWNFSPPKKIRNTHSELA
jgi:hypothetical protein